MKDAQGYNELLNRAEQVMPGGINSCIRNYPHRFVTARAEGAYFWDQTGKRYIDYLGAWGPTIIGYGCKPWQEKVAEAVMAYDLYGVGVTEPEVALAEKIIQHVKGVERVLLCNGGSDATYHAIRVARGHTGRNKIVKMQGAFHGWHDSVLTNVISTKERAYKSDPATAGALPGTLEATLICRINDLDNFQQTVNANKGEIAAVLVDPFCSPFGFMRMHEDYIRGLRRICDEEGIVLIFDEVVSGFRVGLGGAAAHYDVKADLICMGKAIANGYPVAALGGKKELMDEFNTTSGKVSYQATYYGHPAMAAAALATIEILEEPGFFEHVDKITGELVNGMMEIADRQGVPFYSDYCGGLLGMFWGKGPYQNFDELLEHVDAVTSNTFRMRMTEKGYFFSPGPYRRITTSHAHTSQDIAETLQAAEDTFKELK